MIKIEVHENNITLDLSRKHVLCHKCGTRMPCMYLSPSFCPKCDEDMFDVLGLIIGSEMVEMKFKFHKMEIVPKKRPKYLIGFYD